jgi:hypothetical protein
MRQPIGKHSSQRVAIAETLISGSSQCYRCRRGRKSLWGDIDAGIEVAGFASHLKTPHQLPDVTMICKPY